MDKLKNILSKFKSSDPIVGLRNLLLIRPIPFRSPKIKEACVSDFFFFDCSGTKNTQFFVTNLASQLFFDKKIKDSVSLIIFNLEGKKILHKDFSIKKNQLLKIDFSQLDLSEKKGSFFVFHRLSDYKELIESGSYGSERGYVAYKEENGIWNFMHGNTTASYLDKKNKIKSLASKSLFKSYYIPQVLFQDTDNFSLIFNNPSSSSIFARVILFDKNKNIVGSEFSKLKRFETKIFNFDNSETYFVKIESNLIFCRPIIKKVYKNSHDFFHG